MTHTFQDPGPFRDTFPYVIPDIPVGYRIRRALEVAQVTPEALAERLGVHSNTVWNYISGRTRPRRMALTVVAEMTNVPLWWLEGTDDGDTAGVTNREQLSLFDWLEETFAEPVTLVTATSATPAPVAA